MVSEIIRVDYRKPTLLDNGFIKIWVGIDTHRLAFSKKQKEEAEQAYNYIKNNCGGIELLQKEYRKKCNVCGHIFCYTGQDIQNNKLEISDIKADSTVRVVFEKIEQNTNEIIIKTSGFSCAKQENSSGGTADFMFIVFTMLGFIFVKRRIYK